MEGDCVTIDSDEDDYETGFRNYNSPRHRSRSRTGSEFCEGARFGQSRHPEHNLSQPHARGSREENYVDRNSRQDYFRSRERDRHREREYDRFLRRDHHDNIHDRRRNCLHDKYDHMHNKRKRSASRESSVKFMRSSSRNSNRSASSDGPKSFEEMARGILAGTLRDDDTPPAPPAVQFASFGRSVSPTPPMPMFGAPAPPSHAHSEFDLLRLREMGSLPAAATPPASAPHPIMADTQRQQEDMCSRVAEALAHTDQRPSRVLRLERPVGSLELSQIYASICPQPCDHLECKKFPSCLLFPMVKDHGGIVGGCVDLEFQSESSAAVFKRVLSGHSISSHHVPASSRVLDTTATTRAVKAEDRAGIPKRIFKETYLLCSVAVDVISSSCVDHGTVSAPVKICIYSGHDCVTRALVPLQLTLQHPGLGDKLGLEQRGSSLLLGGRPVLDTLLCRPGQVLTDITEALSRHLNQYNSHNPYDKIVFLFKTWSQADVLLKWIKLAECENQFLSLVHLIGVIPSLQGSNISTATGWKVPPDQLGVQEEALAFYSLMLDKFGQKFKQQSNNVRLSTIVDEAVPSDRAMAAGLPRDQWKFGTHVCVLSVEYLDINGEYQLSQIGAVLFHNNSKDKAKKTYFSVVLPSNAANDPVIMADLGLTKNEVTGKVLYHNLSKMASFEVISEIQALLDFFAFLKSNNCTDSILVTYSSYTTLPVILQLVERHGLENIFYQMFSAYCDLPTLLDEIYPNNDHFAPGLPPFQELASEICSEQQFMVKPSAVDSAVEILDFLFTTIEESSGAEGRQVTKLIKHYSRAMAALHYTEASCCHEMFPSSEQFVWPRESKLVEFQPVSDRDVDFSQLVFILHSQVLTGSDKLILISSNISKQRVSVIVQNISTSPFLLNPKSSLGFLIVKPQSLRIPRTLPRVQDMQVVKRSSTQGLYSKTKKLGNEILFAPLIDIDSNIFDGVTNLTNMIKNTINQIHTISPLENFPGKKEKFDIRTLSLRCLKQKGSSKNLIPVEIHSKSLWLQTPDPLTLNILPWDTSLSPEEDFLCTTCNMTRGLHFPDACPSLEQCHVCKHEQGIHSKADCPNLDFCWNCGEGHFWKSCPTPLLSTHQKELLTYGYSFKRERDKTEISKNLGKNEERKVFSRRDTVSQIMDILKPINSDFKGTFLIGYNIFMILVVIVDMAESCGMQKSIDILFKNLRGVIDLKWLFPKSQENKSLEGLCRSLDLNSLSSRFNKQNAELKYVDRAITELLRCDLNMSIYEDVRYLCTNYSLKVVKTDLKVLSRKQIVAEKTLFRKLRKMEDDDEDESSDDDGEIMKTYTKIRHKKSSHHMNQLVVSDKDEFIFSVKTFEVGGRRYLHSLALGRMNGPVILNFPAIVPSDFYNKIPGNHDACCKICMPIGVRAKKPVLHVTDDCPGHDTCTIHPPHVSPHRKLTCEEARCWNCGADHNWRQCPDTILTQRQHFLSTVGYKEAEVDEDGQMNFTFSQDIDNIEVKIDCVREDRVYGRLTRVLQASRREGKKIIFTGYNISEQLHDLLECCENSSLDKEEIINCIDGICDMLYCKEMVSLSLRKIAAIFYKRNAKLKETEDIVKSIAMVFKGKKFEKVRKKATVKFSKNLSVTLTHKNVIIVPPSESIDLRPVPRATSKPTIDKSLLVYVNIEHSNYIIKHLEMLAKVSTKKSIPFFHQGAKIDHSNEEEKIKNLFDNLLQSEEMQGRQSLQVTIVTICPESYEVLLMNFERIMKTRLSNYVGGWISLATELSFVNHFLTKLPPFGIPYEKDLVAKVHAELHLKPSTSDSGCRNMDEIYQYLTRVKKDLQQKPTDQKFFGDKVLVFFEITYKDDKFTDQFGCRVVKNIKYKISGREADICERSDAFFQLIKARKVHEKVKGGVVFVGIDEDALLGLFQIAFRNSEIFEYMTLGVITMKDIISSQNLKPQGTITDYLLSFESNGNGGILDAMEKAAGPTCSINPFSLYSPRVNKILVDSSHLPFSDKLITIRLKRRHWSMGKNICDGQILKFFWNVDKTQDVKLNIFSFTCVQHLDLVVPAQTSVIRQSDQQMKALADHDQETSKLIDEKQRKIKVVIVNKSKQVYSSLSIDAGAGDNNCVFGVMETVPKTEEVKLNVLSQVKGFEDLREDFFKCWPNIPKKKKVMNDMITSFQRLGFNSFQEALAIILVKSKNVQKLFFNMHEFVTNDFHNCAEVAEVMFRRLYQEFISKQKEREKYPDYKSILAKRFPHDWTIISFIDGVELKFNFEYENKHIRMEEEGEEIIEVEQDSF